MEVVVILVTGATGKIGTQVVNQLSQAGAKVRALVRNPQKAASLQQPNVDIATGDLKKSETLAGPLKGIDHVLLVSSPEPEQVQLQHNLIEAAKRSGVEHIVKISAVGASLNSNCRFLRWHAQTEQELKDSGIAYTLLQPGMFAQNALMFAPSIAAQGSFSMPSGDARMGFVDVRDIAAVAVKTLMEPGHQGKTYVVTGPEALSYGQVAEKLSTALGKKITFVNASPEEFKKGALAIGMPEWLVDALNELYGWVREGGAAVVTDVVARVAGKPPISFDQFAREHAEAFRGRPATA
jgi:uncharacterized protein YbjT (DUF2867 family)